MDESRYSTPLSGVFSRAHKLALELRIETLLVQGLSSVGKAPAGAYESLRGVVESGAVTVARVLEIEAETHHDIMAMVKALSEASPEFGGYVHVGATSQDVNDSVLALQLSECRAAIMGTLTDVRRHLTRLAAAHRSLACIARTHGQHAIPTTMGFKFANYLYEISVAQGFLERVEILAKFSGAVGTFASLGTRAVQTSIMSAGGLRAAPISTQVVSRLHHLDYVFAMSAIAAALERLGKELRNLQRSEIGETFEGFGALQVGSSTMPQKRNPHKMERVCGLARVVRAQFDPAAETVSLEHERDLTNSSTERITLPTASILTHYIALETAKVLEALRVDEAAIAANLHASGGRIMSERIMIALSNSGRMGRQEAHEVMRRHAPAPDFVASLKADARVIEALGGVEALEALLRPETYVGLAPEIVDDIVAKYGVPAVDAGAGAAGGARGGGGDSASPAASPPPSSAAAATSPPL